MPRRISVLFSGLHTLCPHFVNDSSAGFVESQCRFRVLQTVTLVDHQFSSFLSGICYSLMCFITVVIMMTQMAIICILFVVEDTFCVS